MKVIVDIKKDLVPSQGDILVYDEKAQEWAHTTKVAYLAEVYKEIEGLRNQLAEAEKKIANNGENIRKVASVVKENL